MTSKPIIVRVGIDAAFASGQEYVSILCRPDQESQAFLRSVCDSISKGLASRVDEDGVALHYAADGLAETLVTPEMPAPYHIAAVFSNKKHFRFFVKKLEPQQPPAAAASAAATVISSNDRKESASAMMASTLSLLGPRFCCLFEGVFIIYDGNRNIKASHMIDSTTTVVPTSARRFTATFAGRIFYFVADTPQLCDEWTKAILATAAASSSSSSSSLSSLSSSSATPAAALQQLPVKLEEEREERVEEEKIEDEKVEEPKEDERGEKVEVRESEEEKEERDGDGDTTPTTVASANTPTSAMCPECGEAVTEDDASEHLGQRWHLACFKCNECNVPFFVSTDSRAVMHRGKPFHPGCLADQFPATATSTAAVATATAIASSTSSNSISTTSDAPASATTTNTTTANTDDDDIIVTRRLSGRLRRQSTGISAGAIVAANRRDSGPTTTATVTTTATTVAAATTAATMDDDDIAVGRLSGRLRRQSTSASVGAPAVASAKKDPVAISSTAAASDAAANDGIVVKHEEDSGLMRRLSFKLRRQNTNSGTSSSLLSSSSSSSSLSALPAPASSPLASPTKAGPKILNPSSPAWLPSSASNVCMNPTCNLPFTLLRQRQHCRLCGRLFCPKCTQNKYMSEKVCDICFSF